MRLCSPENRRPWGTRIRLEYMFSRAQCEPDASRLPIPRIGPSVPSALHADGECLRYLICLPSGSALERLERTCLIEMQHGIELVRHPRPEVVAHALGFRAVHLPD